MFVLSQMTEISIIAAMGGASILFAAMTLKENKKERLKKDRKKSEKIKKKVGEEKKKVKEKPLKKEKAKKQKKARKDMNKLPYNAVEEQFVPEITQAEIEEKATLSVLKRKDNGEEISGTIVIDEQLAEKGDYKLGSKKPSDYVIKNQYISGTHAIISKRNGKYYIMDISRNGTQISAIPYSEPGKDLMMVNLETGRDEELLDKTVISLAGKIELLFQINKEIKQ